MENKSVKIRLTDKERAVKSTKNKMAKGYKHFSVLLSPNLQEKLTMLAESKGLQKKQVVEMLIDSEFQNLDAA